MLKLCATSISQPLHFLLNNRVTNECYPNEWEKASIIPVHKKGHKQIIQKNYRAVLLLPICSKIFEEIIFDCLFKFLEDNKLLTCNQSSSRPDDSCMHYLLSITREIYKSCNTNLEENEIF